MKNIVVSGCEVYVLKYLTKMQDGNKQQVKMHAAIVKLIIH
jgi:hypothetical protein